MNVTFTIPGKPKGKERPRFFRARNFIKSYTPKETASYENLVKVMFLSVARKSGWKLLPLGQPLSVKIITHSTIPASWSHKKQGSAWWCCSKPDADNIGKIVCDALNGIAYHDDAQVVVLEVRKMYSYHAHTIITLETL